MVSYDGFLFPIYSHLERCGEVIKVEKRMKFKLQGSQCRENRRTSTQAAWRECALKWVMWQVTAGTHRNILWHPHSGRFLVTP